MNTQFLQIKAMQTNISLAETWLIQMGKAAEKLVIINCKISKVMAKVMFSTDHSKNLIYFIACEARL